MTSAPTPRASAPAPPTVAVVGAGAAGALVALHLCDVATRRRRPVSLALIDPAPEAGRGAAYATKDPAHRLNVPVAGMSCHPDDPDHFRRWLCRHGEPDVRAGDFVPRYRFGSYLSDSLGRAVIAARGTVSVRRLRAAVTRCRWPAGREQAALRLADGTGITADHVVLATGPSPGGAWLPPELRQAAHVVPSPWEPGALDALRQATGDVLLVGSGLTAVDLALLLVGPGRTVHAVSRSGLLPQKHAAEPLPPIPPPPGLDTVPSARRLRTVIRRHLAASVRERGDWRPAMDGLRPVTDRLWQGMSDAERADFLARDATAWNTHRHRMPPATAEAVDRALATGRLRLHRGRVSTVRILDDGRFDVVLADGKRLLVTRLVDCTGPGNKAGAGDPLWDRLLADGIAVPGPLGMGVATDGGRLLDVHGCAPRSLHTLGAPRRGELWETTAIPEIREQAAGIADALLPATASAP